MARNRHNHKAASSATGSCSLKLHPGKRCADVTRNPQVASATLSAKRVQATTSLRRLAARLLNCIGAIVTFYVYCCCDRASKYLRKCTSTYIHAYVHGCTRTDYLLPPIPTDLPTFGPTDRPSCLPAYLRAYLRTYICR